MVWFTTKVWTRPRRASGSSTNLALPHEMQCGWIDGGVLIVPQSTHRAPSSPSISSAPRTNCALRRNPHRHGLTGTDELATSPQDVGVRRGLPAGECVSHLGCAADRLLGVDLDRGGAPAAKADDRDGSRLVERTDAAEQRGRGAGVTELRVHAGRYGYADAELLGDDAPSRPSGSGSDHARTSSAASCSASSRMAGTNTSSRKSRGS